MRRQVIAIAALFASLSASSVSAQITYCGTGEFVEQALDTGVTVYRVAVPKSHFYDVSSLRCPGARPACPLKAYLIAKNQVLVSAIQDGWACAWYEGPKAYTVGWLRTTDLARETTPAAPLGWVGDWSFDRDSHISITRDKHGGLHVNGDTVNTGRPSMPSGGFEGDLMVDGPTGIYSAYDAAEAARYKKLFPEDREPTYCTVKFRRVGRYLIANDGEGCSGMGADFMGVYTR